MTALDDLLTDAAVRLDGYHGADALRSGLMVAIGTTDPSRPEWDVYMQIYAKADDAMWRKINEVAWRAGDVKNDAPVDEHDAPCQWAFNEPCPDCRAINADLLADAVRDLRALLGDRAVAELSKAAA